MRVWARPWNALPAEGTQRHVRYGRMIMNCTEILVTLGRGMKTIQRRHSINIVGLSDQGGRDEQGIQHARERNQKFWEERDHLEGLGVDGRTTLKWILRNWDGSVRTGFIWLRIGTRGGYF
jgi:hypothetical protein